MAGERVKMPIGKLAEASLALTAIVTELENASGRQDDVEDAVMRPYGDGRLKDRCHDFEGSWNDSRDKLLTKLTEVAERVKGTVEEVTKFDVETAASMSESRSGSGSSRAVAK